MIDDQKQLEKTSEQPEETSGLSQEEVESPDEMASVSTEVSAGMDKEENLPISQESLEALQQENEALRQQLEEQKEQGESLKSQYLRIAADFENFRRRTSKEKEELTYQIKRNTINELLPVVDNFERARSQIKPQNEGEMAIHKSYQGVYKNMVDSLKRLGVSAMRPEGQEFDPNLHEAMLQEPNDEYPEGTVIEQLVRGYLLGEKVLRHAMVKVAAPKEPMITSEEENTAQQSDLENTSS